MPAIGVGTRPPLGRKIRRWPLPTQVEPSNLVLWLRANEGVTRTSGSITNDTTEASNLWTKSSVTRVDGQEDPSGPSGTSAIRITDTNDGAPIVHRITRSWSNIVAGNALFDVWLKQGTLSWSRIAFGAGANSIYLNLGAATVGTAFGGVVARLLGGAAAGWQKWRVETPTLSATNMIIDTANADNGVTYQGDGTGTLFIGTGATYGPVLHQDRVTARADQSPAGNSPTQATDASQPFLFCRDAAGLLVPYAERLTCEIGWPSDTWTAPKIMNYPAGLSANFNGEDKPETLIAIVKRVTTFAATGLGMVRHTGGASSVFDLGQLNTLERWRSSRTDEVPNTKSPGLLDAPDTWHSLVIITDGQVVNAYVNGVPDPANPGDLDVGTSTLTASTYSCRGRVDTDIAAWKSALSFADARRVENGLRVRNGMPPL